MKIGIAAFGCDSGRSGIGQYLIHLLRGFVAARPTHEYVLFLVQGDKDVFAAAHDAVSQVILPDALASPLRSIWWHQVGLPGLAARHHCDVMFLPAANRRVSFSLPCPVVGTVHDLAPAHVAGKYDGWRQTYVRRVLPWLVRRLDRVVTVSHCTARDVRKFARVPAERISVIPNGVDHQTYQPRDPRPSAAAVYARYGVRPPYLLYVSRLEHPGKNHVRLIEAFARLKRLYPGPLQLVLAGPDRERADEVHRVAAAAPCADDIKFTGFVAGADLPHLYAAATAFVMPSLFEGFGIPVIEAMACGIPVACSNTSSLPEVAGTAALMFDPRNPLAMADRMATVCFDAAARYQCITAGLLQSARFNWIDCARQTLDVIERTARGG